MNTPYFPEASATFRRVLDNQLAGRKIAVIGHRRPDGDCIGSQVALCRVLMQCGVDAIAVNADPATRVLEPFIGDTPFATFQDFEAQAYAAVTTDCADLSRIGPDLSALFPEPLLNVDHHISNTRFAANNIVLDDTCATAEILAGIFFDLGLEVDAVTARLEALHAAQLLSDDELFALEDCVADFIEAQASYDVVTMEAVNANRAIGKVHKLVALGEGMPSDAMFARQLRRKFV